MAIILSQEICQYACGFTHPFMQPFALKVLDLFGIRLTPSSFFELRYALQKSFKMFCQHYFFEFLASRDVEISGAKGSL